MPPTGTTCRSGTCAIRTPRATPGRSDSSSEVDDRADRLALVHQVEGFIDVLDAHGVRDEGRQLDLVAHRLLHHAGQLAATLHATESRALPGAAGDQLERTGGDLLPGARHADDDGLAPAAMR